MANNTDDTMSRLRDRYRGSLLGVLIGDCFGAPFEGRRMDPVLALDKIEELASSESSKPLRFTDDTSMTITTLRSLLANKKFDARHLARSYSEAYFKEPRRGYGAAVTHVFSLLRDTKYQDPFGPGLNQFNGQGSYGNGAAMRCNGIALFAHKMNLDQKATMDLVEDCSRITHSHRDAIKGAILLVSAIIQALNISEDSADEFDFINTLIETMTRVEVDEKQVYTDKLMLIKNELGAMATTGKEFSQSRIVQLLGNDVSALGSVPLAIFSFLRGISKFRDRYQIENEFLRTLHWAISSGGDTDTIASMACGLMGAYLGANKIPEIYYRKCESFDTMIGLADNLIDLN